MKTALFFLGLSKWATGAVIQLSFSGVVDEVTQGDLFPEGSPFEVYIEYNTPEVNSDTTLTEVTFAPVSVDSRLIIGGTTFTMPIMSISGILNSQPGGNIWSFGWVIADPLGAGSVPPFLFSDLVLSFELPESAIDDPQRLPSSLDQWDLNAGTFDVTFFHEDASQNPEIDMWAFRSSSTLTPVSLGAIPEPSGLILLGLGGFLGAMRRKRANR